MAVDFIQATPGVRLDVNTSAKETASPGGFAAAVGVSAALSFAGALAGLLIPARDARLVGAYRVVKP